VANLLMGGAAGTNPLSFVTGTHVFNCSDCCFVSSASNVCRPQSPVANLLMGGAAGTIAASPIFWH
jgi:hypothetical protein